MDNSRKTKTWGGLSMTAYVIFAAVFIFMAFGFYCQGWSYDFIVPWSALVVAVCGVEPWMSKNKTIKRNDTQRLSDSRKEKLSDIASEILEKTYLVHRSIMSIACIFASGAEADEVNKLKKEEGRSIPPDGHVLQAEIFSNRYRRYDPLFAEYYTLDIKAKIYLNDTVAELIAELKSVIGFVAATIGTMHKCKNDDKYYEFADQIWAFSTPDNYKSFFTEKEASDLFVKNIESFATVCDRLHKELEDYIKGEG